jgi:hypothetical protein
VIHEYVRTFGAQSPTHGFEALFGTSTRGLGRCEESALDGAGVAGQSGRGGSSATDGGKALLVLCALALPTGSRAPGPVLQAA